MAYTKEQLRNGVLQELGVLAPGETATADDADLIEAALVRLHARLGVKGLTSTRVSFEGETATVTWTLETVPDGAADAYMIMCAAVTAGRFGLLLDRRQELLALSSAAEAFLRQYSAAAWDGWPTPVDGIAVSIETDYGEPVD